MKMIKEKENSIEAVLPHSLSKGEIFDSIQQWLPRLMKHHGYKTISEVKRLRKQKLVNMYDTIIETYLSQGFEILWVYKEVLKQDKEFSYLKKLYRSKGMHKEVLELCRMKDMDSLTPEYIEEKIHQHLMQWNGYDERY